MANVPRSDRDVTLPSNAVTQASSVVHQHTRPEAERIILPYQEGEPRARARPQLAVVAYLHLKDAGWPWLADSLQLSTPKLRAF